MPQNLQVKASDDSMFTEIKDAGSAIIGLKDDMVLDSWTKRFTIVGLVAAGTIAINNRFSIKPAMRKAGIAEEKIAEVREDILFGGLTIGS